MTCRDVEKSYLFSTAEEEIVGVNAISNGTSDQRDPVENNRGLLGVLE